MVQQVQQTCSTCHGEGIHVKPGDRCKACNGQRILTKPKKLEVAIEAGMQSGETVIFRGESHQEPEIPAGDVIITLVEKPHPKFIRKGSDLYTTQKINLVEAVGGFSIPLELPDKRKIRISSGDKMVSSGDIKVIKGEGFPHRGYSGRGDLFVKFDVQPVKSSVLDEKTIRLLEAQLGQARRQDFSPVDKEAKLVDAPIGSFDFEQERQQQQQQRQHQQQQQQQQQSRRGKKGGGNEVECAQM